MVAFWTLIASMLIMTISLYRAARNLAMASEGVLRTSWRIITVFIGGFLIGYGIFSIQLWAGSVPPETGKTVSGVFFTGAVFVLFIVELVSRIAVSTIKTASEERDRFFDTAVDLICVAGFDGYFKKISPSWENLLGFSREELCSKPFIDFVHPDDVERTKQEAKKISEGAKAIRFENRYRTKDGGWVWLSWSAAPNIEERIMYTTARDITDLKSVQDTLSSTQERFTLALKGSNDGIWDWDLRTNKAYFSERWKSMLGYSSEEIEDGFETWRDLLHPEDRDHALEVVQQYLEGEIEIFELEFRMRHKNGDFLWILSRGAAVRDENGKALRLSGAHTDITERKRADEQLRKLNDQLQAVLDTPGDVIIAWMDQDGIFQGWNGGAERVLGWTAGEVIGKKTPAIIHDPRELEERAATLSEELGRSISPGFELFYEFSRHPLRRMAEWTFFRKDGTTFAAQLYLSPFKGPDGEISGMLGVAFDVSRRREVEEVLRSARDQAVSLAQAKTEFLANMSHEIRTPMNGVVGMVNLLLETGLDREQRDYAETVHSSAQSLLGIINDILDFSKIETGKLVLENLEFNLTDCIEDVVQLLLAAAHAKDIRLSCFIDPTMPRIVRGDAGRLRQILVNLLGNAVKFTESGDVVIRVVWTQGEGSPLRFEIQDSGLGISTEDQKKLFEAFTQVDSSMSRRFGGTGLGLAISQSIVSVMGGRIGVESEEGRGSLFWFEVDFPVVEEPVERSSGEFQGSRILVIDENPISLEIMDIYLGDCGFCPTLVESADKAHEVFAASIEDEDPFPLVVLGRTIVGDSEENQLRWFTALGVDRPKLLMMTSIGSADRENLDSIGADCSITKPARRSILHETILALLRGEPLADVTPERSSLELNSGGRVLIAEDNPVNQQVVSKMLMRFGLESDVVANGKAAVAAVTTGRYSLVLMDCQMPILNGYDAARSIRKLKGPEGKIPIIGITAHALKGDREKVLEAGMDDYLAKPIGLEELRDKIKQWQENLNGEAVLDEETTTALMELDQGEGSIYRELVESFLRDAPGRISTILDGIKSGRSEVRDEIHTLKGSSVSLGVKRVGELCAALESDLNSGGSRKERLGFDLKNAFDESFPALRKAMGDR